MSWTAGTQVSGYEITRLLGVGGMGEVYLARNLRLQRDVALKVLPTSVLQDPERRSRFEREARVLASLSHPNIAAIHGIEDMSGPGGATPVLVLEFVDGQTLADRIGAGPVPVEDAIPIALQIAEALEAAHERGIIHRDLKPANVQVTRDGVVKVLDFGLAKALDADPVGSQADPAQLTDLALALGDRHELGMIMGTAAYMAPEQARGKTVDRRADIWAFGALLFEMLSGKRAFPGETISDTLAAILATGPEWTLLPQGTPPAIRALIERCLERDPRQRLQSIGEARIILSKPARVTPASAGRAQRRGISLLASAGIAIGAVALSVLAMTLWMRDAGASSASADPQARSGARRRADAVRPNAGDIPGRHTRPLRGGREVVDPLALRLRVERSPRFDRRNLSVLVTRRTAACVHPELQAVARPVDAGEPELVGPVPDDMTGSGAGVWTAAGNFLVVGSDTRGSPRSPARTAARASSSRSTGRSNPTSTSCRSCL